MDCLSRCLTDITGRSSKQALLRAYPKYYLHYSNGWKFTLGSCFCAQNTHTRCCTSLAAVGEAPRSPCCTAELQTSRTGQWLSLKGKPGLTAHRPRLHTCPPCICCALPPSYRNWWDTRLPVTYWQVAWWKLCIQYQYWNLVIKFTAGPAMEVFVNMLFQVP